MRGKYELDNRKYVIGGIAIGIILIYLVRLFTLQLLSEDYKRNADSNAFMRRIQYPARGAISDRNGKLLVYNQPAYDLMVVMVEQRGVDTLDLCQSLGIGVDWYERRMNEIKDPIRNPGYSPYTQQLFMSQLSTEEFSRFQEKLFLFPGFYIQKRSIRQYSYPYAAHILGDVGEVGPSDIERDGKALAGEHAQVGARRAGGNCTVAGEALARSDGYHVALAQLGYGNLAGLAVTCYERRFRSKLGQGSDSVGCVALAACFKVFAEHDERYYNCRAFEKQIFRVARVAKSYLHYGIQSVGQRGKRAYSDECVHIRVSLDEAAEAVDIEIASADNDGQR